MLHFKKKGTPSHKRQMAKFDQIPWTLVKYKVTCYFFYCLQFFIGPKFFQVPEESVFYRRWIKWHIKDKRSAKLERQKSQSQSSKPISFVMTLGNTEISGILVSFHF